MSRPPEVVLVTQFFPPETGAGARRAGGLAHALHAAAALHVVTLAPGYPDPALYAHGAAAAADAASGLSVERGPAFRPHEASLTKRAQLEIGMAAALVRNARRQGARVWVASTPSMFLGPLAWWAARRSGVPFVWDLRDMTWRYALEAARPNATQRLLLALIERVMLAVLRRSDLVVAATPGIATLLAEQGVRPERMVVVPNGVDRAFLERLEAMPAPPARPRPRVRYVGLMGHNHSVRVLVDMARELPEADVCLAGDGPERAEAEAHARALGCTNVRFEGYAANDERLAALYADSDVLVAHTRATPTLDRIVIPAKTWEYLASGRPVVYAGAGDTAERLRALDLALVVPPGDAHALATAVRTVFAEPAAAAARAARARAHVRAEELREPRMQALAAEIVRRFGLAPVGAAPRTR